MSKLEPIAFEVAPPAAYDDARVELLSTLQNDIGFDEFVKTISEDAAIFEAVRDETYNHDQLMEARAMAKYARHLAGRVRAAIDGRHARLIEKTENEKTEKSQDSGPRI
jgi:hypothetical protein